MKTSSHRIGELKVIYRTTALPYQKIRCSQDTFHFLQKVWDQDLIEYIEQFCIILLSRSNQVIGYDFISMGGTAGTVVDAKVVFQTALLGNASSIILAHNHPSGNMTPSEPDKRMTTRVFEIGKSLDMPILDHMIVSKDQYFSFADEGILR